MPELTVRTGDDYADGLAALLPQGRAWPREPGSVLMLLVRGLAEEWARLDARAATLLGREADPRSTIELLADWERAFGLPDPCTAEPLTIEARQKTLFNRVTMEGGQSRAFFIGIAVDLGYQVTIRERSPFMAGISRCGDTGRRWEIGPPEIRFYWTVAVPVDGMRLSWFRAGSGRAGIDPHVRIAAATDLICILSRLAPAHTQVLFEYAPHDTELDMSSADNSAMQMLGWI